MRKLSGLIKNIKTKQMKTTMDIHIYILNRSIIACLRATPSKGTP